MPIQKISSVSELKTKTNDWSENLAIFYYRTQMSTACRYADKFLGQLAQKYPGIALFFVETDYDEALLDLEEISFLPTIIVKLNGQVFKKLVGKLEGHENDLIAELSQVLGK